MRLNIESWAGGGRGVARVDGRVWFVAGALPGEEVDAEPRRRRAGVVEASAVRVHRASGAREPDPCPIAERCGGCDLAHLRRDAVADALRAQVLGALRHAPAALGEAVKGAGVVVSPMRWRLRARLHWDPGAGLLGFFAARSHEVVAIDPCRVASPRLLAAVPPMAEALRAAGRGGGEVDWLEDLSGEHAVAGWSGDGLPPGGPVAGVDGWWRLERGTATRGWGIDAVTMGLPVPLLVPLGAFFQGNRHLVPRLFERVSAMVRVSAARTVVDLFGGVGFFAAAARDGGCNDLVVVESNPVAVAAAARNLPGARVLAVPAEDYLAAARPAPGTFAVVDPPRLGLSALARARLAGWGAEEVLLVSCDAARFGRDAAALLDGGYALESVELWDLFGGSHHVEILARFGRG